MAAKVFFIFHYEQELWRARIVGQRWLDQGGEALGFWDEATWKRARTDERHLRLIDDAISKVDVTAVLVTQGTSDVGYVQYTVRKSHEARKGLMAVYIHNIQDAQGRKAAIGNTHFGGIDTDGEGNPVFFWQIYPTHRWVFEDGPRNLKRWIEDAVMAADRNRIADARSCRRQEGLEPQERRSNDR